MQFVDFFSLRDLRGLCGEISVLARTKVRAGAEIGRKNNIFFTLLLLFSFPSLTSLRPLRLCVKKYTFARANVVIAGSMEAMRARLTADLPAVAGDAETAEIFEK